MTRFLLFHHLTDTTARCSPDGRTLAFDELDPVSGWDIWTLSLDSDRKPRQFVQTSFNEWRPRFSPDGRWLAYQSNESGRYEVYVRPFPGPGPKTQVSTDGGGLPVWGRDGQEILYRNPTGIWVVPVDKRSTFSVGLPKKLFSLPIASNVSTSGFDVSPEGHRLLLVNEDPTRSPRQLNVILNWFSAK
jgi:dipeptidyl aminopeptidase/acylaminoacyl peptidase